MRRPVEGEHRSLGEYSERTKLDVTEGVGDRVFQEPLHRRHWKGRRGPDEKVAKGRDRYDR